MSDDKRAIILNIIHIIYSLANGSTTCLCLEAHNGREYNEYMLARHG